MCFHTYDISGNQVVQKLNQILPQGWALDKIIRGYLQISFYLIFLSCEFSGQAFKRGTSLQGKRVAGSFNIISAKMGYTQLLFVSID